MTRVGILFLAVGALASPALLAQPNNAAAVKATDLKATAETKPAMSPSSKLTESECTALGGKTQAMSVCMSGTSCYTIDEKGHGNNVCISKAH